MRRTVDALTAGRELHTDSRERDSADCLFVFGTLELLGHAETCEGGGRLVRVSMASLMNSACSLFLPVALLLMLSQCPAAAYSTRRCHSIYKGFAQCLMSLGDSLTDNARKDEDTHEIHSICRSWDEFHDCANVAMAGCPDEAAAVWESLRQESKKMQFSGNLYDMCSNRNSHAVASASPRDSPNQEEINQESLRGHTDHLARSSHLLVLLAPLLLLLFCI
ncbi:neuritin 1-like a [Labrus mixtus]|uniref:neuritin 1-like a n=1 Tax=Labrus mixtus TaxID=508554 RepID=UPI0029C092AE|nr:neuritin 1-like a [Labrus mixtus]